MKNSPLDFLTPDRIQVDSLSTWEGAVRQAALPLLNDESIRPVYVETVIAAIRAPGGTYMDLGFGFTLAHARPDKGVIRSALSLLVLKRPVLLNDDERHPMRAVIFLAAADDVSHQESLAAIAPLLMHREWRDSVFQATSSEEIFHITRSHTQNDA